MDIYVQNCHQCNKRASVASMVPIRGKRYCEACATRLAELARLAETQCTELRMGTIRCKPAEAGKRPRGMVKWWDEKAQEWRWVSKRSKPELGRYEY